MIFKCEKKKLKYEEGEESEEAKRGEKNIKVKEEANSRRREDNKV